MKCILLLILLVGCESFRHSRHLYAPKVKAGQKLPPDEYFEQKLDHFDPTNQKIWKQRYQVNDTFHTTEDGPVFIMIGGEGATSSEWLVAGAWIDYAEKYGALCFQLEHRYYGKSRPTSDMSTKNLKYLSSEQALADIAYFIEAMKIKYNLNENNKWIAFGGSYPGSLAAWMRYKYPHLIYGAVSTSGPLLAIADFKQYNEVVKNSLATHSDDCALTVKQATKHLDKLVQHDIGAKIINKKFRLCKDIDVKNKNDVSSLTEALAGNFADIVQYNKDKRMSKSPTSNITIDTLCEIMTDRGLGEPIDRYAKVNDMMMDLTKTSCLDYSYQKSIDSLKNTTWSEASGAGGRQWIYQTCTEFGFYQTSSTSEELFGVHMPLEFYVQQCADIYGPEFTDKLLNEGIKRTNTIYGETHLTASRVLFVHGSIDPWHALGITTSKNTGQLAIYIQGTAHCANMYPPSDDDSKELKIARQKINNRIGYWLNLEKHG